MPRESCVPAQELGGVTPTGCEELGKEVMGGWVSPTGIGDTGATGSSGPEGGGGGLLGDSMWAGSTPVPGPGRDSLISGHDPALPYLPSLGSLHPCAGWSRDGLLAGREHSSSSPPGQSRRAVLPLHFHLHLRTACEISLPAPWLSVSGSEGCWV